MVSCKSCRLFPHIKRLEHRLMGEASQDPSSASLQICFAFVGRLGSQPHHQLIYINNQIEVRWNCINLRWKGCKVHLHFFSLALECEHADAHATPTASRHKVTCWNKAEFLSLPLFPLPSSLIVLIIPLNHLHSGSFLSPLLLWRKGARHVMLENGFLS